MLDLKAWNKVDVFNESIINMKNIIKDKKVVLYGAGALGVALLGSDFVFDIILDKKFKKGDIYRGISAFSPFDFELEDNEEDYIVIVAVRDRNHHKEIFELLKNIGFNNIILAIDYYECQIPILSNELKQLGFNYYIKYKENILKAMKLFKDDLSLSIFSLFMQTHMERQVLKIPCDPDNEQYFPKDIKLNKGYNRVINCGSYVGDTIKQLHSLFGKIEALACFEPDLHSYKILTEYLKNNSNLIANNIVSFPCGVFNKEAIVSFMSGDRTSSSISIEGKNYIQCITLDNALPGYNPTFINMDIEGAELLALHGAENLIKEYKPDLAICVYHSPNDIWDIPLYLNSLNIGYNFYLRNYTGLTYETILYATSWGGS